MEFALYSIAFSYRKADAGQRQFSANYCLKPMILDTEDAKCQITKFSFVIPSCRRLSLFIREMLSERRAPESGFILKISLFLHIFLTSFVSRSSFLCYSCIEISHLLFLISLSEANRCEPQSTGRRSEIKISRSVNAVNRC